MEAVGAPDLGPWTATTGDDPGRSPGMADTCRCGSPVRYHAVALACIACGTECCPCCTLMSESAPYCVACFEAFLEDVTLETGEPGHAGLLERRRRPGTAAA
jgi:hypothetical protein